ncbi:AAA family ATPase [Enterococcus gallinarum]|uniref:AAA family ATPase n=1 Tax=Enterococcus gallinarum TaxID=1353 RepID=UPI002DBD711E|nr:AAA family ATPase [Enterococcus gallinarum]MEB6040128.1 AAA family ATPase [Enterococcus gallinarum]
MYLNQITFPDRESEGSFFAGIMRTVYDSYYPYQVLSKNAFSQIDFEPITILYGGNGSGKTTALNVLAEKIGAQRSAAYNRSNFFEDYLDQCHCIVTNEPKIKQILTSDDVFDYMLDIRNLNQGIDRRREEIFDEYFEAKYANFRFKGFEDYERLKKINLARSNTQSKFTRKNLMDNVREFSNGENAASFFQEKIVPNGLYLLDELENSLSAQRQIELVAFIEDMTRYEHCQFVIATHSPFVLSIKEAKIYDLDQKPVDVRRWTQLENVQTYYRFFQMHQEAFEDEKRRTDQ